MESRLSHRNIMAVKMIIIKTKQNKEKETKKNI